MPTLTLKIDLGFSKKKYAMKKGIQKYFYDFVASYKYKSYSLIGLKCITCLKIILQIHLQNMHALSLGILL